MGEQEWLLVGGQTCLHLIEDNREDTPYDLLHTHTRPSLARSTAKFLKCKVPTFHYLEYLFVSSCRFRLFVLFFLQLRFELKVI